MSERIDAEQIQQYWTNQALMHGESADASWSDTSVIHMEIAELCKHLRENDTVLDIGCGNGYSTIQLARRRRISIRGLDYIPEMIDIARRRLEAGVEGLLGQVEFAVGDLTALDEPEGRYDKLILVRVLINLGTWGRQEKTLRECVRVVKPGGLLLASEATLQGWRRLNEFRAEWQLPPIPMPSFNCYLDEERVVDCLSSSMHLVGIVNFASTYYVGTRVLKPLLANAVGLDSKVPDPTMHWNRWFSQLPPFGDYGTQKLFVFERR
jgi:ubiquinone/menaquinone biosynthesis C-methylase UbiE